MLINCLEVKLEKGRNKQKDHFSLVSTITWTEAKARLHELKESQSNFSFNVLVWKLSVGTKVGLKWGPGLSSSC